MMDFSLEIEEGNKKKVGRSHTPHLALFTCNNTARRQQSLFTFYVVRKKLCCVFSVALFICSMSLAIVCLDCYLRGVQVSQVS